MYFFVQEQMEDLKNYSERMERQVSDIQAENRKLVQPLKEATEKVNEMTKKIQSYEKDRNELAVKYIITKCINKFYYISIISPSIFGKSMQVA